MLIILIILQAVGLFFCFLFHTNRQLRVNISQYASMVTERSSVEDVLERIISELEREDEKKNYRSATKRKLEDTCESNKRRRLSIEESFDLEEVNCRICYDSNPQLPIVYPCKCKGTIGAIHLNCLEHWLEESNRNSCELCGYRFVIERTPRYTALRSVPIWLCLRPDEPQFHVRSLRGDMVRCLVVTPITIACSYICIVAADFYATSSYDHFPSVRWAPYCVLAIMLVLIFSYFVWMYMAIQYHQRAWFYWWQTTSTVKIILPLENTTPVNCKSNISQV